MWQIEAIGATKNKRVCSRIPFWTRWPIVISLELLWKQQKRLHSGPDYVKGPGTAWLCTHWKVINVRFIMYIKVKSNNWNRTQELQTLPTRPARLITARERKSLCKTNSLTQTIKRSCEENGNCLKSAHGIVDNPFKANSLLPKCLGKNTIKLEAEGKGIWTEETEEGV